jgi:hypothetical protein
VVSKEDVVSPQRPNIEAGIEEKIVFSENNNLSDYIIGKQIG